MKKKNRFKFQEKDLLSDWGIASMLIVGKPYGKTKEAIRFYTPSFGALEFTGILHYTAGEKEGRNINKPV